MKGGYVVLDPGLIPDRGLLDELAKIPTDLKIKLHTSKGGADVFL